VYHIVRLFRTTVTIIDMTFHNLGEVIFDVLLYFIRSRYRCVGLSIMYQTETYIAWLKIASARHDFVARLQDSSCILLVTQYCM